MEATWATTIGIIFTLLLALIWVWLPRLLKWLWLEPKRLERLLREQGLKGNSYRFLNGDLKEILKIENEARSKPMSIYDDLVACVFPYLQQSVNKHGKNSFIWFGPTPRVTLADPELIKEVLNRINDFQKPELNPLAKLLVTGLVSYNGEKWNKHRKIAQPAFNFEKLKDMFPIFFQSCSDLISEWERIVPSNESCEMDVWPFLQNMTSDVISRSAFGSSYEEGRRIFELLKEQVELSVKVTMQVYIPGLRFLPTAINRKMKENGRDIRASLKVIINKKKQALKEAKATNNDLLSLLLESNQKEIQKDGNNKNVGMNIQDVVEECKLFYFAGQETTSVLLVWTMVLLGRYTDWQARAREEVFQVFGNKKPDYDQLSQLKIVNMILHEVLRLYPPVEGLARIVGKDVKLGNMTLPTGVQLYLPIILVHHDHKVWGDDAKEFNPERFSEGVSKATNVKAAFFPFGGGQRVCIGQNFSLVEAKLALAMMLQKFSFELSPAYTHAPAQIITLQPQKGAHIIMHKVKI